MFIKKTLIFTYVKKEYFMWTIWIPLILQCFGDKFDENKRMIWRNCFNVSNGIWLIGYYSPSERLWSSIWPLTYGSGSQSSVSLLIVSAVLPLKVHKTPNPILDTFLDHVFCSEWHLFLQFSYLSSEKYATLYLINNKRFRFTKRHFFARFMRKCLCDVCTDRTL